MIRGGFLSAKERTASQAVMRHPSETHGVARRANAILLLDDGWNCAKVAEAFYLDDDTVLTWFKRYQAGGLDEMKVFDGKGRSGDLSRERMAELSARPGERLMRDSGEVAAYIAARWGVVYGHSGCVALLHRLGFEYKRPESLPARSDEASQAAFISRYDQLLNGLATDEVVYFADAVHPEYQSRPAHGWVRKGDKVALRRTSGRQRLNLHAALNLENFHRISTALWSRPSGSMPPPPSRCSRSWRPATPARGGSTSSSTTPVIITPVWSGSGWRDQTAASRSSSCSPMHPISTPSRGYGLSCTAK